MSPTILATPPLQRLSRAFDGLLRGLAGLAADFWKDGGQGAAAASAPAGGSVWTPKGRAALDRLIADAVLSCGADASAPLLDTGGHWQARPGEVEAAMTDASDLLWAKLRDPAAGGRHALCLGTGAGDLALWLADRTDGACVALTGDAALAPRILARIAQGDLTDRAAMLSAPPGDLRAALRPAIRFDAVLAADLAAALFDRGDYLAALRPCLTPGAVFSFTETVADADARDAAMDTWRAAGLDIRLHEDISTLYRRHVMTGLAGFVARMGAMKASGHMPDAATRAAIGEQLAERARQVAALDQGACVYHFQACLADR